MTRLHRFVLVSLALVLTATAGCRTPAGSTPDEKRAAVRQMRQETLQKLYSEAPGARPAVESAVGYAVFSSVSTKVFVVASGRGYGIARERATGKETYMDMLELGGGVGFGVQDLRQILVFESQMAWKNFIENGIEVGGDADVALKSGEDGAAIGASENVLSLTTGDVRIFQLTEAGAAAAATVTAVRYSPSTELN